MTKEQEVLLNEILSFEIDDVKSSFKFSNRLARENDWSLEYCLRAVLEYKRFIFLVMISEGAITPSDQVDQVWHLHLLYTKSYWLELCDNVLKRKIHHSPTKGKEEGNKFALQYRNTLKLYELTFNVKPPKDIWPDVETRFKRVNYTRVNKDNYWIVPKIKLKNK